MRFVSYFDEGLPRYGVVKGSGLIDLHVRLGSKYPSLASLIAGDGLPEAERLAATCDADVDPERIVFRPVIVDPIAIFCTGINYREHAAELGEQSPQHPRFFIKRVQSLVGHRQPIVRPAASVELDFEGELALVIGARTYCVAEATAMDYVAGYTIFNDGSVRDFQKRSLDQGKNFYRSGSCGPYLVTRDEAPALSDMKLVARLNGVDEQVAFPGEMIFSPAALIAYFSAITPLEPGDMIATGTCARRNFANKAFLKAGDQLEFEITGLGVLRNHVIDQASEVRKP